MGRFGWLRLISIALIVLVIFILLEAFTGGPHGYDNVAGKSRALFAVLLTAGTFLGIVGRTALPSLLADDSATAMSTLKASFKMSKLIAAAILSPLVIGYFYSTVRDLDDLFLVFILAFQNGFFWDTVIAAVRAKIQGSAANEGVKIG
jgi:hypothetical protein